MNRLSNYLQCRKIAQEYLQSAEDRRARGDLTMALHMVIQAMRYFITANNNLQSLAFNQKPRANWLKRRKS